MRPALPKTNLDDRRGNGLRLVSPLASLVFLLAAVLPARAYDVKLVTVTNGTGSAAAELHVTFGGAAGVITVPPHTVIGPAACAVPTVPTNGAATSTAVIIWGASCVPAGASVTFVAATTSAGPLTFSPLAVGSFWAGPTGTSLGALGAGSVTVTPMGDTPGASLAVPVTATVLPPAGGPTTPSVIGTITATAFPPGGCWTIAAAPNNMKMAFAPGAGFTWLDGQYEFKWVQVVTAYLVGGALGTSFPAANFFAFPAIDPPPCVAPAGCVPPAGAVMADAFPYYISEAFWTGPFGSIAHEECVTSVACDYPGLSPGPTSDVAVYNAYLVVDDGAETALPPTSFCVLGGFSWYYNDATGSSGIIGAVPASTGVIADALALGPPPFPSWSAVHSIGCPLEADFEGMGCYTYGPTGSPTAWADCSPKLGDPFTWHAAGLVSPTVALASPYGGPVIIAIGGPPLPAPLDLALLGLAPAPGSCFLYVPLGGVFGGGAPSPTGMWTSTLVVPVVPALVGATFFIQMFQPVFTVPSGLIGFAVTPYLDPVIYP